MNNDYKAVAVKVYGNEYSETLHDDSAVLEDALHDSAPNDEWFFLDLPLGHDVAYLRRADVLAFLTVGAA